MNHGIRKFSGPDAAEVQQTGQARGPTRRRLHALLAEFATADAMLAAARQVRDAGFTRWDTHAPYPVHGLAEATGIRRTRLPWLVFLCGLAGAVSGLLLQWWTNAVDYAFVVSGKPFFSLPANIPIMFELTILLAALGAVIGMVAFNGLPHLYHALLADPRFRRATTDRFFISIEAADPKFDERATRTFLESLAGSTPERIEDLGLARRPRRLIAAGVVLTSLALIPLVLVARARASKSSKARVHLIQNMDDQGKFKAQSANSLFADGRAMRPPAPATVGRGELHADDHFWRGRIDGRWAMTFPIRVTEALMRRGQERFNIYCAPCHGLAGAGDGMTAKRAEELEEPNWVPPKSVHDILVRQRPVGHLFNTITNGIRTMAAYGDQIPESDRWAIIAYVRALQRSQSARIEDVPPELRSRLR